MKAVAAAFAMLNGIGSIVFMLAEGTSSIHYSTAIILTTIWTLYWVHAK